LTWHIALTTVYALTCYTVIFGIPDTVILALSGGASQFYYEILIPSRNCKKVRGFSTY